MNTLEALKAGYELISDPARWTQEHYARDKDGNGCYSNEKQAVCWCSVGALNRVTEPMGDSTMERGNVRVAAEGALSRATFRLYGTTIIRTNDERSHDEVMAAWRYAIKAEETGAWGDIAKEAAAWDAAVAKEAHT